MEGDGHLPARGSRTVWTDEPDLQLVVDGQHSGVFPGNGVLNDCFSDAACLAALTTPPFVQIAPGSLFTVRMTFVPLAGQRSWLGFWMNTRRQDAGPGRRPRIMFL